MPIKKPRANEADDMRLSVHELRQAYLLSINSLDVQ